MKIIKKIISSIICLSLGMGMCVPAKAAETAKMRRPQQSAGAAHQSACDDKARSGI